MGTLGDGGRLGEIAIVSTVGGIGYPFQDYHAGQSRHFRSTPFASLCVREVRDGHSALLTDGKEYEEVRRHHIVGKENRWGIDIAHDCVIAYDRDGGLDRLCETAAPAEPGRFRTDACSGGAR